MTVSNSSNGMGDILAPDSSVDPTTLYALAAAGAIIIYLLMGEKKKPKSKAKRSSGSSGSSSLYNDVISGLVGQGASKSQARQAVTKARQKGATGFDGLFRGALKEL